MTLARGPWLLFGPAALVAGGLAVALTLTSDHEENPALATALGLFVSSMICSASCRMVYSSGLPRLTGSW